MGRTWTCTIQVKSPCPKQPLALFPKSNHSSKVSCLYCHKMWNNMYVTSVILFIDFGSSLSRPVPWECRILPCQHM